MDISDGELVLRILAAAALGALVGLDRELSNQPAGLRTHILVSLGACLFTAAGAFTFADNKDIDPTRVAAQVVTGIGFLGAGAIMRQGVTVKGLTTAAGLWVTAAIGTAVALGFWTGAVVTAGVTAASLFVLKRFERKLLGRLKPGRYDFIVSADPDLKLSHLSQAVDDLGSKIESSDEQIDDGQRKLVLVLRLPPRLTAEAAADALRQVEGVIEVDWSR